MFEKTNNYEDQLFSYIDRYNLILQKIINSFDLINIFIKYFEIAIFEVINIFTMTQKIMRYTTFPIHWIWIKLHLRKEQAEKLTDLRLFEVGAHYIYGPPGAGKSTATYHAMQDYANYTGKASLTTHPMELPRKNVYGRKYFFHQLFDPNEFYKEGKQIAAFDTTKFNMVVYEEMLGRYHQRNNRTNEHNDEVLPMVASMGAQRHQGIDLFFFISQLPTNDISIMQMLRGYHIPKIKKGFDYKHWLRTGEFQFVIKGWWFESYHIQPAGRSDYKLVNKLKWFYEFKYEDDFNYFNRLNLKSLYEDLPLHKGVEMKDDSR